MGNAPLSYRKMIVFFLVLVALVLAVMAIVAMASGVAISVGAAAVGGGPVVAAAEMLRANASGLLASSLPSNPLSLLYCAAT